MKILVVDDSRAMRSIIIRTIGKAGFEDISFHEATDGQHGAEEALSVKPDLIMSDWNMPRMDGLEFLQAVREHNTEVVFGFVTSMGTDDMRDVAVDSGANFFIGKPFTAEVFAKVLGPYIVSFPAP